MTMSNSRYELLKSVSISNGTASLFEFDFADLGFPKWSKMIGLVEFEKTSFKYGTTKKPILVSHKLSINLTSQDNLDLYRDSLGNNLCEVSSDYNTWKIPHICLNAILNFDPHRIYIGLAHPTMLNSDEVTEVSKIISLIFLESILFEVKKCKYFVAFSPSLDSLLKTLLTQYMDINKLKLGFDSEIRTPFPKKFEPKRSLFNDIFELSDIFITP
jgi:hypothetical protein